MKNTLKKHIICLSIPTRIEFFARFETSSTTSTPVGLNFSYNPKFAA